MKRYFLSRWYLFTVFFSGIIANDAFGQTAVNVNNAVVTDVSSTPITPSSPGSRFNFRNPLREIVYPSATPATVTSLSSADPVGKCTIWFEYGDGGFTVLPNTGRAMMASPSSAFLMATPLYDTTRGKDGFISRYVVAPPITPTSTERSASTHNDTSLLGNANFKLTPSNYDIVPGELLHLALTYRLPERLTQVGGGTYYVLLYYNSGNKNIFEAFTESSPAALPATLRKYNNEILTANTQDFFQLSNPPSGYADFAAFQLSERVTGEFNFFITLKTTNSIEVGNTSAIQALLVRVNKTDKGNVSEVIGSDILQGMYVARAFDPNDLAVTPRCLVLPKTAGEFKYRVRFQNLGKGPADIVKVNIPLPAGILKETLKVGDVFFSGVKLSGIMPASSTGDTITFLFNRELPGTSGTPNALTNPLTMGEINFTLKSSAAVDDTIKHRAYIYFHSKYPVGGAQWEEVVPTNIEHTVFKKSLCECTGAKPCPQGCSLIILGLCWWWWVLILLAIIVLLWLFFRRR